MSRFFEKIFVLIFIFILTNCTTVPRHSEYSNEDNMSEFDYVKHFQTEKNLRVPSNDKYTFLLGSWTEQCHKKFAGPGKSRRTFFDFFQNKKMNYAVETYEDDSCQKLIRRLAFQGIDFELKTGNLGPNHFIVEQDRINAQMTVFDPMQGYKADTSIENPNKHIKSGVGFYADGSTLLWGRKEFSVPAYECHDHVSDMGHSFCSRLLKTR